MQPAITAAEAYLTATPTPAVPFRSHPSGTMLLVLAIVLLSAATVVAASVVVFG